MAHNQTQAYIWYKQYDAMLNERERELRDSESIANNKICFEVRDTALRPRLNTEGFLLYRPHRTSHTGKLHWGYWVIQLWSTQLLSQPTTISTQEARHLSHTRSTSQKTDRALSQAQSKRKDYNLWSNDHKHSWWSWTTNNFFSQNKILKIDLELIGSSVRNQSVWKINLKEKLLGKKL